MAVSKELWVDAWTAHRLPVPASARCGVHACAAPWGLAASFIASHAPGAPASPIHVFGLAASWKVDVEHTPALTLHAGTCHECLVVPSCSKSVDAAKSAPTLLRTFRSLECASLTRSQCRWLADQGNMLFPGVLMGPSARRS